MRFPLLGCRGGTAPSAGTGSSSGRRVDRRRCPGGPPASGTRSCCRRPTPSPGHSALDLVVYLAGRCYDLGWADHAASTAPRRREITTV